MEGKYKYERYWNDDHDYSDDVNMMVVITIVIIVTVVLTRLVGRQ